jgi:transcriptional regulator with XRE-family HTH domain
MEKLTVKKYLEYRGISIRKAAREIGCTRQRLSQIVNGGRAGRRVARLISDWSGGFLSVADLMQID